ncbi:Dipeptide transport system permease protein DppB [subsurface metagenome]|jgi:peptide/nickel transport system permease protein
MRAYAIRRLLLIIPTLFIVSFVIFLLIRIMPGNVIDAMIARLYMEAGGETGTTLQVQRARLEEELGLDVSIPLAYGRWLGITPQKEGTFSGVFQGDLGVSFWDKEPVLEKIRPRWPITLELGVLSLILTYLVAIPVGIYSAVRQDTWGDYLGRSFAVGWLAVPNFWLATLVMVFPAIWWGWSPPIFIIPFAEDPMGNLGMFIIPAFIMGFSASGRTMRDTRTWMLEVLRQDYIRTAWAKGLKERTVLIRHAFRNTLVPIVTEMGYQLPVLIGGAVIMENIFCLPGLGQLSLISLIQRDYPVVCALLLIGSFVVVFGNLLADLAYGLVDPRIRYR